MMETICNVCRKKAEIEMPQIRQEGDLEIQYITCQHCGQEYVIAVTDPELRKDIQKYMRLQQIIRSGKGRVSTYREAESLHTANVKRSRELIEEYLEI